MQFIRLVSLRLPVRISLVFSLFAITAIARQGGPGLFEGNLDIGDVGLAGSAAYDPDTESYRVAGGGENMWFEKDAFHFVWKKWSGDVSLAADVAWATSEGNPHKKAGVMFRQSLDPDAPYADVVVHGDGLTSIQYREEAGGLTHEIQSTISAPGRVRLNKYGDYVYMEIGEAGGPLRPGGGMFRIRFSDPFYVGLAVCAHDNAAIEEADFSNIEIMTEMPDKEGNPAVESTLEIIDIGSTDRRVVHVARQHFEAPNWTPDGERLLFNSGGRLYAIPVGGGEPEVIDTGFANRLNNDHGISPDGTQLVISDHSQGDNQSRIYVLPIEGGTPRLVTPLAPSYWHGWSPDGSTLAYVGLRNGDYDIYTIPVEGGPETQLTTAPGLDDGPDYSPDGRYIYLNSVRTGTMQIWRMNADGSDQVQMTFDDYNDWFPHPSPDGKWLVFVSYEPDVEGHPANKDVMLRIMPAEGGEVRTLAKLFGGQGTINVPSWSPDSQKFAFVSYRLVWE